MSDPVIIKRYQNRRLYDTESSSYVNIDHLAKLVEDGRTIKVVDAKTGEDLTRRFLTQILIESEGMLPLDILQQLACVTDRAFRDFLNWYLSSAVAVYKQVQDSWQKPLHDLAAKRGLGVGTPGLGAAGLGTMWDPSQVATAIRRRWEGLSPTASKTDEAPEPEPQPDPETGTADEVDRLAQRLAALEAKLSQIEGEDDWKSVSA